MLACVVVHVLSAPLSVNFAVEVTFTDRACDAVVDDTRAIFPDAGNVDVPYSTRVRELASRFRIEEGAVEHDGIRTIVAPGAGDEVRTE